MTRNEKLIIRKDALNNWNLKKSTSQDEIFDKGKINHGEFPYKQFQARNSVLTDLYYENIHIRTITHIALTTVMGYMLYTAAYDYLQQGQINLGFNLILGEFVNLSLLIIWIRMVLATLFIYYGFKVWVNIRIQLNPKMWTLKVLDRSCLVLLISYYPTFVYLTTLAIIRNGQQQAASVLLFIEAFKSLTKCHAFIRSNAPRVLRYKAHSEKDLPCPDLNKFLYFIFAPTLIYQDNYPRTKIIRWNYVIVYLTEFFGGLFLVGFIFQRFLIPVCENYGVASQTWKDILVIILINLLPSICIFNILFYVVLHAAQNAVAEVLTFADKLFYQDWWTSSDYARYFRTWNVIVYDWFYAYVYKDLYGVTTKNKVVSKIAVFFISAVLHEFTAGVALRFCLPIVFVNFFGFGVSFTYVKFKNGVVGNMFLWLATTLGSSLMCTFYLMEHYARVNCPIEDITISSYFIPQLFICKK